VCLLFIKKNPLKLPPNRKQNIYIGSQITAYAREVIYKDLVKIQSNPSFRIHQVECDSIFFSGPKNLSCPLPLSHAFGDYKIEHSLRICTFYAFGPKHYFISYFDQDNVLQSICKYSGLNLKTFLNESKIDKTLFKTFLDKFISNQHAYVNLEQPTLHVNFKKLETQHRLQKFCFQNKITTKRIIDKTDVHLKTYPYGFN